MTQPRGCRSASGRPESPEDLDEGAEPDTVTTVLVTGMSGVGKSTVAVAITGPTPQVDLQPQPTDRKA
jgi:putative ribosome biogenesis GTPase RsgA